MLRLAYSFRQLDFEKLMEVYSETNQKTGAAKWHREEPEHRRLLAEEEFYQYLREIFFRTPGAVYAVWMEGSQYCSALRLEPYQDGFLLESLETRPDARRKGYAQMLLQAVEAELMSHQGSTLYSHVHKKNAASLSFHRSCGFSRALDYAKLLDGSVDSRYVTLMKNFEKKKNSC